MQRPRASKTVAKRAARVGRDVGKGQYKEEAHSRHNWPLVAPSFAMTGGLWSGTDVMQQLDGPGLVLHAYVVP
jgi:hypothetical protein